MDKKLIAAFKKYSDTPVDYNVVKVKEDVFVAVRVVPGNAQQQTPNVHYIGLIAYGARLFEASITPPEYQDLVETLAPKFEKYKNDLLNSLE